MLRHPLVANNSISSKKLSLGCRAKYDSRNGYSKGATLYISSICRLTSSTVPASTSPLATICSTAEPLPANTPMKPADLWTARLDKKFQDRAPKVIPNPKKPGLLCT